MGEIDVAVHSLKDVTVTLAEHLVLAAYLPREDARDCLIGPSATIAGPAAGRGGRHIEPSAQGAAAGVRARTSRR